MNTLLIVLVLIGIAVAVAVWVARRKPDVAQTGPRDGDTAWNDPVTPGEPARPTARTDAFADAPSSRDPQP